MAKKHLMIGCGIAALSAVNMIRTINSDDEITLVSKEDYLPYSPAVLPYLISRRIAQGGIWLADEDYFAKMGCSLRKAKEVSKLRVDTNEVIYKDGEGEGYDTLLIASGSEPVRPPVKGLDEVEFFGFHTLDDYEKLGKELGTKRKIVVYGGGLVALELSAALLEAGHEVCIVARSRIARKYFDEDAAATIADVFRQQGAQIYNGKEVVEVRREGNSVEYVLSDGGVLDADLFVSCIGVKPRIDFLIGTQVKHNVGVLVDRSMKTNIPNVYAAGDVTESLDYFCSQQGISAIAPTAINQGRVAGANMVGEKVEDRGWIPMNVFKFFNHATFSIGPFGTRGHEIFRENSKGPFRELVFQDDRLIAARFIDVDIDPGVFRYLIEEGIDIGRYKEMLFERPREVSLWLMLEAEKGTKL